MGIKKRGISFPIAAHTKTMPTLHLQKEDSATSAAHSHVSAPPRSRSGVVPSRFSNHPPADSHFSPTAPATPSSALSTRAAVQPRLGHPPVQHDPSPPSPFQGAFPTRHCVSSRQVECIRSRPDIFDKEVNGGETAWILRRCVGVSGTKYVVYSIPWALLRPSQICARRRKSARRHKHPVAPIHFLQI